MCKVHKMKVKAGTDDIRGKTFEFIFGWLKKSGEVVMLPISRDWPTGAVTEIGVNDLEVING